MARYLVDALLTARVVDLRVEIDPDDPRPHQEKLIEAARIAIGDRLTMLDHRGARGATDGAIAAWGVERAIGWDMTEE